MCKKCKFPPIVLIVALLALLAGMPAVAMERIGGSTISGAAAVRGYNASEPGNPFLTDRTEDLATAGAYAIVHDGLFVAVGTEVRYYDRIHLSLSPRSVWSAGAPVLSIADGPERGLVLVLDRTSLRMVRFSDSAPPVVLWTFPVDGSALTGDAGRMVLRSGDLAYVADASIPGVRVLSIDPGSPPATVATYISVEGVAHDMTLWSGKLSLLTEGAFVLVDTGSTETPVFQRLGAYATLTRASSADANTGWAFVGDGSSLVVLDINPVSASFLQSVSSWTAPAVIRSVRLDKGNRAYVLGPESYDILDITPFGGK